MLYFFFTYLQALLLYQRRLAATLPLDPKSDETTTSTTTSGVAGASSSSSVDSGAVLGAMKCLDAMGEWQAVLDLCFETWAALNDAEATEDKTRKKAAALAAHAAWSLGQWDNMERLLTVSRCLSYELLLLLWSVYFLVTL